MRRWLLAETRSISREHFQTKDSRLGTHDNALVAVNLYAGNQYWFSVGATEPVKKIGVTVYDEAGKQVTTDSYDNGDKAAAGFSPAYSGQYFVSVDLVEGEQGSFCLVYSYK